MSKPARNFKAIKFFLIISLSPNRSARNFKAIKFFLIISLSPNRSKGTALFNRLDEHRKSIEQATNLEIGDFWCRYLVVDDIWIPLGESLLIQRHRPIWNSLIDGFGNHDPGSGRHQGARPN